MEEIKWRLILNGILMGWWISNFIPLQDFITKYIKPKIKINYINTAMSCFKCLSFWFTLLIFAICESRIGFFEAIIASLIAYIYERIMNTIKIRL